MLALPAITLLDAQNRQPGYSGAGAGHDKGDTGRPITSIIGLRTSRKAAKCR